jgi:hypothetical protein
VSEASISPGMARDIAALCRADAEFERLHGAEAGGRRGTVSDERLWEGIAWEVSRRIELFEAAREKDEV